MVVDIGFLGNKKTAGPIASRPKPYALNLSGDAMRQHERAMELKHRLYKANLDLDAAMDSLSSANAEIDRLNAKVASLEAELNEERDKNLKLSKTQKKPKKDKGASSPES